MLSCATLRLDVRPLTDGKNEFLQFAFNFNHNISLEDDAVSNIKKTLKLWDKAKAETKSIVSSFI